MKIHKVALRRFKSIREVTLPGDAVGQTLDNLIILIGRNSSGKSNLLEALDNFFREFDPAFERSIGAINHELWYGREVTAPIEWEVTLQLEEKEISTLLGNDFLPLFAHIQNRDQVSLLRRIVATPQDMRWQTMKLKIGGIELARDGKALAPEEIAELVTLSTKPVPANFVQVVLSNLSGLLRSQFKYIGAARDSVQPPPSFGNRASIINPTTLASINNLAQGIAPTVRSQWGRLLPKMETTLPNRERVDSRGGQLFLANEPLPATGGGAQSVLALIHDIETGAPIIAIEEPENHLHPELIKKTLSYFQGVTTGSNSKQLFVATHSPFFVDTSNARGIIALYWDGQETSARQIGAKDDLRTALYDIGARPSDIFFADLVLIVEGESDKVAFENWARILGVPLEEIHAGVVQARGIGKIRYHLRLLADISKGVGLPRYVIVDKNGQDELNKVVSEDLVEADNFLVLERGDLEDYYPVEVLRQALATLFGVTASAEDLPSPGRVKAIAQLIKKDPFEWKVPLADEVSRKTARRQVPREIADFLRRIHNETARR